FEVDHIKSIPFLFGEMDQINSLVEENIQISKEDWDAHETSWDFEENELVKISKSSGEKSLENLVKAFTEKWESKFRQLQKNETELNRQFIEIYGLQDELSPEVPASEITILQQGEISIDGENITWNYDNIIKQFVSYGIGCIMGRYSTVEPGLILANQESTSEDFDDMVSHQYFEIDADGIVPLMPDDTDFADNAVKRLKNWMEDLLGEDMQVQNLNYISKCLGKSLEDYMMKDFWKDHKRMYQNRPIYWLFASKKNAFLCIIYMHRMNKYIVSQLRNNYLLGYIEWLEGKKNDLQSQSDTLTTRERKDLDNINKQIEECREYDDRLHSVADQEISIDLDDGVATNYAKFGNVVAKIK
ncbi:MAG: SAM-dependent methyltransferase, partial [Bacteroidales bacterium]|nr:SAM-dependent methyltransferase [Bacteroidales bacterium]